MMAQNDASAGGDDTGYWRNDLWKPIMQERYFLDAAHNNDFLPEMRNVDMIELSKTELTTDMEGSLLLQ